MVIKPVSKICWEIRFREKNSFKGIVMIVIHIPCSTELKLVILLNLMTFCLIIAFMKVFEEWNEIAKVVRRSEFEESEDEQIDIFDVKVRLITT